MRAVAISLIPAVLFVLILVYLLTPRGDDEEQPRGHGWTFLDALFDLLSFWR
jgi:hypothetical protein